MNAPLTGIETLDRFEAMLARWDAEADKLARDLAAHKARIDAALEKLA